MTPRDYARLHHSWFHDPVLVACADQCPTALHIWPVLVALSKSSSHVDDNPTGVITTSAAQIASLAHVDKQQVAAALDLLAEGELVSLTPAPMGTVLVALNGFGSWQTPRGSSAQTSQTHRDKQKAASREKKRSRDDAVTSASTKNDGEGEGKGEEREAAASSSTARGAAGKDAAGSVPPKARSIAGQIQSARRELGGTTAFIVEAMIGRRQQTANPMLSDAQLLEEYWKPMLHLLHEHGALRLRDALGKAAAAQAVRVSYLRPILAEAAAAVEAANRPRRKLADVLAAHEAEWAS